MSLIQFRVFLFNGDALGTLYEQPNRMIVRWYFVAFPIPLFHALVQGKCTLRPHHWKRLTSAIFSLVESESHSRYFYAESNLATLVQI
jgi:hypothetical protein